MLPAALVVAAAIDTVGVLPLVTEIGAVPDTPVTPEEVTNPLIRLVTWSYIWSPVAKLDPPFATAAVVTEIAGVVPPLLTTGAVPDTLVT